MAKKVKEEKVKKAKKATKKKEVVLPSTFAASLAALEEAITKKEAECPCMQVTYQFVFEAIAGICIRLSIGYSLEQVEHVADLFLASRGR